MGLESVLAQLEQAAKELNSEADGLNETLAAVEYRLEQAGVGVSLWLDLSLNVPEHSHIDVWRLGYDKIDDRWRIVVREADDDDDLDVRTNGAIPLLSASRGVRIEASQHIEALSAELLKRVRRAQARQTAPAAPARDKAGN